MILLQVLMVTLFIISLSLKINSSMMAGTERGEEWRAMSCQLPSRVSVLAPSRSVSKSRVVVMIMSI